jgi:hypothetical protein
MRVRVFKGLPGLLPFSPLLLPTGDTITYIGRPMKDGSRPRKTIPPPSTAALAAFRASMAAILAQQRVTAGTETNLPAATVRALAELNALTQDTSDYTAGHTKPSTRRPRKKKPRSPPKQWLEEAAQVVTERRIAAGQNIDPHDSYQTVLNELRDGYFNRAYWSRCDLVSEDFLSNVPTLGVDPHHRSYAYPDPDNARTYAVYGEGVPAEAPPRYSGNTLEGEFRDSLLVWRRANYELLNPCTFGAVEPTFIEVNGSITAFADQRGSRPMLSWVAKTWNVAEDSARRTTTEPPTVKKWSWYYRYKLPRASFPYYEKSDLKQAVRTMRQPKHEEDSGTLTHSVVLTAPRPMYGRGFNNNTAVTTQLDLNVNIWQIEIKPHDGADEYVSLITLQGEHTGAYFIGTGADYPKVQGRYYALTDWYSLALANFSSNWLVPPNDPAFIADLAAAALGSCEGTIRIHNTGVIVSYSNDDFGQFSRHEITRSPYFSGGEAAVDAWADANNYSMTAGPIMMSFAWLKWSNQFIPFFSSDYEPATGGGLQLRADAIARLHAYDRPIYRGSSLIWSPPP